MCMVTTEIAKKKKEPKVQQYPDGLLAKHGLTPRRAAYSPKEFAASCGRHPSWAYRLLYGGKIRALTDLGRILIPASELERVLSGAAPYNPKPRKTKTYQSGATIGGDL